LVASLVAMTRILSPPTDLPVSAAFFDHSPPTT